MSLTSQHGFIWLGCYLWPNFCKSLFAYLSCLAKDHHIFSLVRLPLWSIVSNRWWAARKNGFRFRTSVALRSSPVRSEDAPPPIAGGIATITFTAAIASTGVVIGPKTWGGDKIALSNHKTQTIYQNTWGKEGSYQIKVVDGMLTVKFSTHWGCWGRATKQTEVWNGADAMKPDVDCCQKRRESPEGIAGGCRGEIAMDPLHAWILRIPATPDPPFASPPCPSNVPPLPTAGPCTRPSRFW